MKFRGGYSAVEIDNLLSDEQAMELFAHFGRAVYASNLLEHGIINALFILDLLPNIKNYASEEDWSHGIELFFREKSSKTMGNLIRDLEKTGAISQDTIELLMHAKLIRDNLIHHFNRDSAELHYTDRGRKDVMEQCRNAALALDSIDTQLEEEIAPIRRMNGVDDSWLEARYRAGIERLLGQQEE